VVVCAEPALKTQDLLEDSILVLVLVTLCSGWLVIPSRFIDNEGALKGPLY
jgi:hypothetical protein